MMGIRRLFIAESKDTRKKDSAWPSGIFDFYTPNIRSRPKAKQSDAIQFSRPREGIRKHSFFHFRTATCHTANEQR